VAARRGDKAGDEADEVVVHVALGRDEGAGAPVFGL
jgi:hypothetical protein